MKTFLSLFSVTILTLATSLTTWAAFPCPSDSCNPHNNCMDGCRPFQVKGTAACNEQNPSLASKKAIQDARLSGFACGGPSFDYSKWIIQTFKTEDTCIVLAKGEMACM